MRAAAAGHIRLNFCQDEHGGKADAGPEYVTTAGFPKLPALRSKVEDGVAGPVEVGDGVSGEG